MHIYFLDVHTNSKKNERKDSIMQNSNMDTKKSGSLTNQTSDVFSNCHRTGSKRSDTSVPNVSETDSDQDSANAKYVVKDDKRERKDGPGGE